MNGGIEQPLPPTLRGLPIAWVFLDVRYETRVEDRFAIVPGVEPAIQVEVGPLKVQIRESGHALQRVQPLWQEHRICFVDWCDGNRRQHESVVVDDREDFFALLVFVAGIADPIAAFLGHGVGAIAMQDTEIEVVVRRQMLHTGDKCLFKRSIVGPFRESFVDCRVMDSRLSVGCPWDRQALPLHACVEHPQNEVEDAMIAEFTPRPPPGHRQVRKDKCDELWLGELNGNRRRRWTFGHIAHRKWLDDKHEQLTSESPIGSYNTMGYRMDETRNHLCISSSHALDRFDPSCHSVLGEARYDHEGARWSINCTLSIGTTTFKQRQRSSPRMTWRRWK